MKGAHVRKVREIDLAPAYEAGNFDPLNTMFEYGPELVKNARGLRKDAVSHRNVRVGGAVLAHNVYDRKMRIYVGWNYSPYDGADKYCSEMRAIGHAITDGYSRREAVFVAGETDAAINESIIHLPSRILPPCEPCRELLEDETLVMAFGGEEDIYGAYSGRQLKGRHLLGSPVKVKPKRRTPPVELPPAYDLADLNWAAAGDAYRDLTKGMNSGYMYEDELRMARAEAAVKVLTSFALAA
jgi:cytidine deaminase